MSEVNENIYVDFVEIHLKNNTENKSNSILIKIKKCLKKRYKYNDYVINSLYIKFKKINVTIYSNRIIS